MVWMPMKHDPKMICNLQLSHNQNYGGRGPPQPRRIPPRNTNGAFSHYPRGVSPPTGHPPSQQQQQQQQQYQQSSPAQQDYDNIQT